MANMLASVPVEETKLGDYLHDRTRIPEAPSTSRGDRIRRYLPLALQLVFALGAVALGFQVRASWESHRDWVIPVTVPFWALAGVAMAYLASRGKFNRMAAAAFFLMLSGIVMFANYWRGTVTEGQDNGRDALSILAAFLLAITILLFVVALARVLLSDKPAPPAVA